LTVLADAQIGQAGMVRETAKTLLLYHYILSTTSWYRPQHINHRVGGVKDSRHLFGDAVDISSDYLAPQAMYKLLDKIHMRGGLGRYYSFVHIDFRGEIARWLG
jgi:zinc D-Ala-D-Ala carboxypeptidase